MNKHKIVCVIDMQNDFIDGSLGSKEALSIVDKIKNYLDTLNKDDIVIFTRDTHLFNELSVEMNTLPKHCIKDTNGHEICDTLKEWMKDRNNVFTLDKESFMSLELHRLILANVIKNQWIDEDYEIEVFGLCTDICVISNALSLRAHFIDKNITVLKEYCAGSTNEKHLMALEVMKSNLINIK